MINSDKLISCYSLSTSNKINYKLNMYHNWHKRIACLQQSIMLLCCYHSCQYVLTPINTMMNKNSHNITYYQSFRAFGSLFGDCCPVGEFGFGETGLDGVFGLGDAGFDGGFGFGDAGFLGESGLGEGVFAGVAGFGEFDGPGLGVGLCGLESRFHFKYSHFCFHVSHL